MPRDGIDSRETRGFPSLASTGGRGAGGVVVEPGSKVDRSVGDGGDVLVLVLGAVVGFSLTARPVAVGAAPVAPWTAQPDTNAHPTATASTSVVRSRGIASR
jgi:hypothetical protein